MLGAIALGLLQLIALKFTATIWQQRVGFLRTRSRALPSERTVKLVITLLVVRDFLNPTSGGIICEIRTHCSRDPAGQTTPISAPESERLAA